jgi:hypothetical protein
LSFTDLQATVKSLESREKDVVRRNFDLEAMYYQLKSKYVLLLNHMQSNSNSKGALFVYETSNVFIVI